MELSSFTNGCKIIAKLHPSKLNNALEVQHALNSAARSQCGSTLSMRQHTLNAAARFQCGMLKGTPSGYITGVVRWWGGAVVYCRAQGRYRTSGFWWSSYFTVLPHLNFFKASEGFLSRCSGVALAVNIRYIVGRVNNEFHAEFSITLKSCWLSILPLQNISNKQKSLRPKICYEQIKL